MRDGLRSAALRLKHDLGKYVRLTAPDELESDVDELRRRLAADLLETRRTPERTESAAEVFEAWMREDGPLFEGDSALRGRRDEVAFAVASMRPLLSRLQAASPAELRELDALSLRVAASCGALLAEAVAGSGGAASAEPPVARAVVAGR